MTEQSIQSMQLMQSMQSIILAAGRSSRMGRQKLLLPFGGVPILERVIMACREFKRTVVVVSCETFNAISPICKAEYIVNRDPDRGQDSSLKLGLEALQGSSPFALFLGDKPLITLEQVGQLYKSFAISVQRGKSALVPRRNEAPGHPGFYMEQWREYFLSTVNAGENAKAALLNRSNEIEWVSGYDGCFWDIDTEEDYIKLLEK